MFSLDWLQDIYVLGKAMVQKMVFLLTQRNFWTTQLYDLVDELHGQLLEDLFHVPFKASTITSQITPGIIWPANRATIMSRILIYKAEVKKI